VADHPRVVARGDVPSAEAIRDRQELAQLHRPVAGDAGARRLALEVGVDETSHHLAGEELTPIEGVVGDAEVVGDASGVVLVLGRTAAALLAPVGVVPEVEGHADDVVALVDEPRRSEGRVDPSAHRDDDALFGHGDSVRPIWPGRRGA